MITPAIDAVVMELYQGYLDAYWEPERKMVETRYRTIEFPFPEIPVPRSTCTQRGPSRT